MLEPSSPGVQSSLNSLTFIFAFFQVYKGRGWELSENHILYSLGHASLLLKDHYTAASLFNELVATTNTGNRFEGSAVLKNNSIHMITRSKQSEVAK